MYSRAKDTMKELQDEQNILEFPYWVSTLF
jgi:hypothetical protein